MYDVTHGIFCRNWKNVKPYFITALRTASDDKYPLFMVMISMDIMGVGMSYVSVIILGLGLLAVFIGFAVDELTRGILNMLNFKTKAWYQIKLT